MMEYRRRLDSDVWHHHPKCRWWPKLNRDLYRNRTTKPTSGELCDECLAKSKRDTR